MRKIAQNQGEVSNQDVYDSVNQYKMNTGAPVDEQPDSQPTNNFPKNPPEEEFDNPLEGLEQFDEPVQETPKRSSPIPPVPTESEEELFEDAPSPPQSSEGDMGDYDFGGSHQNGNMPQLSQSTSEVQELIESIIEEKWDDLMTKSGDMNIWKEQVNNELISIKQEIIRTQDRFENLQGGILGKVSEYGGSVKDMNTEIKALEQVLQKILQPLSENIRTLQRVTRDIKAKPPKSVTKK